MRDKDREVRGSTDGRFAGRWEAAYQVVQARMAARGQGIRFVQPAKAVETGEGPDQMDDARALGVSPTDGASCRDS